MGDVNVETVRDWRDEALNVLQEVDAPPFVAGLAARIVALAEALLAEA